MRSGFLAFAPALAGQNDGFNPAHFARFAELEARSFWFVGRNRLLQHIVRKHFPSASSMLEIGCGTGFVLQGMRTAFPALRLCASDIYTEGLSFAARRVPEAFLFQMDARQIPFRDEFDLVAAFDVIEHIEDDHAVLTQMYQACSPGGGLMLTVPQHRWLWSKVDEDVHHKRRYERSGLIEAVSRAGFRVEYATSFVSLLLPLMLLSRLKQKQSSEDDGIDPGFKIGRVLNGALKLVMGIEYAMLRLGITFALGGSLLLVARKPG